MSDLTSPLGGDDLAKALRDAYGWGFLRGDGTPSTAEEYYERRDAWIAQYIARLPAAEQKGASASQTGLLPDGPTASRSSGFAAAIPSRGRFIDGIEDLASEEDMAERGMIALPDSIRYDIEREARNIVNVFAPEAPPALCQSIKAALFRAEKRRIRDVRDARVSNERPEAEDPKGLSPVGRQCDGEAGTPEATPKSSPDQTPVDPPMTVEEARQLLDGVRDPLKLAEAYRRQARLAPGTREARTAEAARANGHADRIELALRTLQAGGEVQPIQIREGAYYASAAGERIGPMFRIKGDAAQVWYAKGQRGDWAPDGQALHSFPRDNLVAEWPATEEPAR